MSENLVPQEMVLMQILKNVENGGKTMTAFGVPLKELGRLVCHAIEFEYVREDKAKIQDAPQGMTFIVPPIDLAAGLTPRGKRYLEHLRAEFEQ